jgi:hypothetical protein
MKLPIFAFGITPNRIFSLFFTNFKLMRMFNTPMKNLLIAVVCLLTGVQAHAQFSAEASQYPTTDYSASAYQFQLSAIAATLDTDAATLTEAISTYITSEVPDPILFYAVVNGEDTPWAAATEADAHGFWMDANGVPVGWGDNARFFASPNIDDAANDNFFFYCGQMPGTMQAGDVAKATLKLKFNGKEASFALTLNVIDKPTFDVPEPTLVEASLNIVGQQEKVVEQFPRGDYSSDLVKVDIKEALDLLGITNKAGMAENISKVIYTTEYNTADVEQGGGMKKDSLTNVPTAGGHGFWYRAVQNADGVEDGEVSSAGWGDTDKFFLENFSYSAEDDSLSAYLGQYPGNLKDNETWFANVYIIYGPNAYRIKYTLKLNEVESGSGMSNYNKLGEEDVVAEQEPLTDWGSVQIYPDLEKIAQTLGCEVSALGLVALDDKDNFGGSTANNGGWWFTEDGYVIAYANGSFYIEPAVANDYSVLNVGHKPNTRQVGDELHASLYFTNESNYYQYNVTLRIVDPTYVEYQFESVGSRTFAVQQLLDNNYTMFDLGTIPVEDIESLIGTANPILYGLNIDSVAVVKGIYSKAWSCDPNPGFWLNKEGRVSTWGDGNSIMGIVYADGLFRGCQKPNLPAVGDTFSTQLFLVNEETEKMITININIAFVETLEEKTEVGSETIYLPVTQDGVDVEIDLSKAAAALEVTVDDLLNSSNYYLRGMSNGVYGEGKNCEDGLSFNPDGNYDGYGNMYFYIAKDGDKVVLNIASNDPVADDYSADGQFCFEVNNNQYVYYAKFLSQAKYDELMNGIVELTGNQAANGLIYDLQGRQVNTTHKGIYIINGKKMVLK